MRILSSIVIIAVIVTVVGCAGYRLGTVNGEVAGTKTVQITPFSNETLEPRLTDAVTTALRRRLQQDGTYRLSTHGDADIVLTGSITKYTRGEISLNPEDTLTVRDYRITITAMVTARSRSTGQLLFSEPVSGYTTARVGTDMVSAERQALPLLADELSKKAVSLLAEGKWW